MAESSVSWTPPAPAIRRAVTLPLRPSTSNSSIARGSSTSPDSIESLYLHPSVRIVAFESSSNAYRRASLNHLSLADAEEEVGTLPWTSTFERTIAVGPLRIYRAPGSVAFINCGRVIQPILPKSRCWCVDDESSKFILQMRRPLFWRIEVPTDNSDHQTKSQELKDVLGQILLFEKTPCPFSRTFHIELPEQPKTPVKKKPWRPVERPSSVKQEASSSINTAVVPKGDYPQPESGEDYYTAASSDDNSVPEMDTDSDATDDTNVTPRNYFARAPVPHKLEQDADVLNRPEVLDSGSVTASSQLTLLTSPPSKNVKGLALSSPLRRESRDSNLSDFSSSQDSFHSVQSWHSPLAPMPPSPPQSRPITPTMYPYPHDNIKLPKRSQRTQDISEIAASSTSESPETPRVWQMIGTPSTQSTADSQETCPSSPPAATTPTPTRKVREDLDEEYFDVAPSTPTASKAPVRRTSISERSLRRRALSPLPAATNLSSPSRSRARHLQTARHLPTAIIQKTWEILMSPPSHLVQLMLEMAAKIAAGQWRGVVFGIGEGGEKVVGEWDYDDGDFVGGGWGEMEEDDYGMTRAGSSSDLRRRNVRKGPPGGFGESWEMDW